MRLGRILDKSMQKRILHAHLFTRASFLFTRVVSSRERKMPKMNVRVLNGNDRMGILTQALRTSSRFWQVIKGTGQNAGRLLEIKSEGVGGNIAGTLRPRSVRAAIIFLWQYFNGALITLMDTEGGGDNVGTLDPHPSSEPSRPSSAFF